MANNRFLWTVPDALVDRIKIQAIKEGRTASALIIDAVGRYLDDVETNKTSSKRLWGKVIKNG